MSDLQVRGPLYGSTGSSSPQTSELTGAQRVSDAHGHYFDLVRVGNVYGVSARNLTLAAGQGYAQAAAATINFLFWNPPGSNKVASLLKFSFGTLSGTPAAGEINYQLSPGPNTITSAANGVHVNLSNGSITGSVMKSWVKTAAAAIAGSVAFNDVRPAFVNTATAAANPVTTPCTDNLDGEFLIYPGMAFTFGCGGAGTTWVASAGLVWEEIQLAY